jgi:hypothetical protein
MAWGNSNLQWRGEDSNLRRQSHRVYSATPLTAREPRQGRSEDSDQVRSKTSGRPGSTSYPAYFGPPRRIPLPPSTTSAGMNQRRPSAAVTNKMSHRDALKCLTTPLQLWFPPRVHSITSHRRLFQRVVVLTCTRRSAHRHRRPDRSQGYGRLDRRRCSPGIRATPSPRARRDRPAVVVAYGPRSQRTSCLGHNPRPFDDAM